LEKRPDPITIIKIEPFEGVMLFAKSVGESIDPPSQWSVCDWAILTAQRDFNP
jgi:hypothetical protein